MEPRDINDISPILTTEIAPVNQKEPLTVYLKADHSILFLLNLPNDVSDISIMDLNARIIMKSINRQESINISNLSRGIFIVKIKSTSKVDTCKFIR